MVSDSLDDIFVVAPIAHLRDGFFEQMFVFAQVGIMAEKTFGHGERPVYHLC